MSSDVAATFATMIRSGTFAHLEELYLAECSLNLESIKHLCNAIVDTPLQLLHTLSLAQNRLNPSCICALCCILQKQQLPSLRELDLSSNKVGNDGVKQFADNDKDQVLTQVEVLNLSDNGISNEGAFVIFDSIRHRIWSNIRDLNLEKNKFSAVTAVQLRSLLEMDNDLDTIRLTDMTKRRATTPSYRHPANASGADRSDSRMYVSGQMYMENNNDGMDRNGPMHMENEGAGMNRSEPMHMENADPSSTSHSTKPPEVIPLEIPSAMSNVASESVSTPIASSVCVKQTTTTHHNFLEHKLHILDIVISRTRNQMHTLFIHTLALSNNRLTLRNIHGLFRCSHRRHHRNCYLLDLHMSRRGLSSYTSRTNRTWIRTEI